MPWDSLLFDLDGTLWDTCEACARGWNKALARLKFSREPFTPSDMASIMGLPHATILEKFFPKESISVQEQLARECYVEELSEIRHQKPNLYPGVEESLQRLSKQFALFLVSNCQEDYLNLFISVGGLGSLFEDSECHGRTKQDKAHNISLMVERAGLKNPVLIGDTEMDCEAAKGAGVGFLQVLYGFGKAVPGVPGFHSFGELTRHIFAHG